MPNVTSVCNSISSIWQELIPETLLLKIFSSFPVYDLCRVAIVCHRWNRISQDEFLWRNIFYYDFQIERSVPRLPSSTSWIAEYQRLYAHTPKIESEVLSSHSNQVLHVSFSHKTHMFATSSKDGTVKVWDASSYPTKMMYQADLRKLCWQYTQFSQFNESDTLLLVSGVHFGSHSTSGEIAVFSLIEDFKMQCRVMNKPYDVFGCWYNDSYLLSGNLYWMGNLTSCSALWLNKAFQALESEHESVVMRLFKFENVNASSIRTIRIANCSDKFSTETQHIALEDTENKQHFKQSAFACTSSVTTEIQSSVAKEKNIIDELTNVDSEVTYVSQLLTEGDSLCGYDTSDKIVGGDISEDYSADKNLVCSAIGTEHALHDSKNDVDLTHMSTDFVVQVSCDVSKANNDILYDASAAYSDISSDNYSSSLAFDEMDVTFTIHLPEMEYADSSFNFGNSSEEPLIEKPPTVRKPVKEATNMCDVKKTEFPDKYLIFTMGMETYVPHCIGVKKIEIVKNDLQMSKTGSEQLPDHRLLPDVDQNDHGLNRELYDKIDHVLDMKGHIIGMCLSPDHRYLYVNSRPWPAEYVIADPLTPPDIAQEIDIHVIDMITLKEVCKMQRAHKAYTINDDCFFIFLDVSENYVASGAEDKFAYIWDRHYGISLTKLQHSDVVNAVAFDPEDPELLVSVSDDNTIKVWRSLSKLKCAKSISSS